MKKLLPSEMLAQTTARLECTVPGGTSLGTGFFFAPDSDRHLLVTNKHVVEDATGGVQYNVVAGTNLVSWVIRNRNATTATFRVGAGAFLPLDTAETLSSSITGEGDP